MRSETDSKQYDQKQQHNAGISGHPKGSTPGQPTGISGDLQQKHASPGELPTGFAQSLLSLGSAVIHHMAERAIRMVVTKLDTPKSDYRERTGTEWLVLGLGWG